MLSLTTPYPFFSDIDGDPLDGGFIFVGEVNQNPETAPVQVFWDEALTQPAAQPLRTLNGHIARNGTPARVYVTGDDFSMTVKRANGVVIFYERSVAAASTLRDDLADKTDTAKGAGMLGFNATLNYPAATVGAHLREKCSVTDSPWLADKTGVDDATAAFNAALAAGFDVQAPDGTFRIDGTVTVESGKSLTLSRRCKLIRQSANSASTAPVVYVLGTRSELTGGIVQSENSSPNGVVCLGNKSATDPLDAFNWRFSNCDVFSLSGAGDIGVNVPSGQVTDINRANYFGFITDISIYGGDVGLLLAEQANAHVIKGVQFWFQRTACFKMRGAYANHASGMFMHQGAAAGVIGVHIANKTASLQESKWNTIIGFTAETGGAGDRSLVIDSNCDQNMVIGGSNVSGGYTLSNSGNVVMISSQFAMPSIIGEAKVYADTSANALRILGRQSDNLGNILFTSQDGSTSYGLIQGRPTEFRVLANGAMPLTFYVDGGEAFRAIPTTRDLASGADNARKCGTAALRWSEVFAGNATINTSDERSKEQIQDIDEVVLRAWAKVNYCQFKMKDAIQSKGDGARWHIGVIAQRVKEVFESEGLDAFAYGLLCYDEWGELSEPELDDKGEPTGAMRVVYAAGNRYGIRYEEALALECAYLRSKLETV